MTTKLDYDKVEVVFQKYLDGFDKKNKLINLKIRHSYEVAKLSEDLAKRLYFTKDEVTLAKIIGLLHDIGRFIQISKTNSFEDSNLDHASEGVEYLFKKQMNITNFIDDRFYDDIIRNAIYYHNKLEIPLDKNPIITKFMKLIRDVDKIDIFFQEVVNFDLTFYDEVSKDVLTYFENEKLIPRQYIKTDSDNVLYYLAFLFDFNYEESYDLLVEKDYLGIFLGAIDVSPKQEEFYRNIRQRIYEKVERGVSC